MKEEYLLLFPRSAQEKKCEVSPEYPPLSRCLPRKRLLITSITWHATAWYYCMLSHTLFSTIDMLDVQNTKSTIGKWTTPPRAAGYKNYVSCYLYYTSSGGLLYSIYAINKVASRLCAVHRRSTNRTQYPVIEWHRLSNLNIVTDWIHFAFRKHISNL